MAENLAETARRVGRQLTALADELAGAAGTPELVPIYDGTMPHGSLEAMDRTGYGFMLDVGWDASFAGRGFEDVCQIAAEQGAREAAQKPGWPTGEAHVRSLPVVDTWFRFVVTPERLPGVEHKHGGVPEALERIAAAAPDDAVQLRSQLAKMADEARACMSGQCDCGDDAA